MPSGIVSVGGGAVGSVGTGATALGSTGFAAGLGGPPPIPDGEIAGVPAGGEAELEGLTVSVGGIPEGCAEADEMSEGIADGGPASGAEPSPAAASVTPGWGLCSLPTCASSDPADPHAAKSKLEIENQPGRAMTYRSTRQT